MMRLLTPGQFAVLNCIRRRRLKRDANLVGTNLLLSKRSICYGGDSIEDVRGEGS